jgi:phage/plasmid primase-like uncharacterized protein
MTIVQDDAERQFLAAMRSRDLQLSANQSLVADAEWHRCDATNKANGHGDGTYKLNLDDAVPWGLYRNWTDGKPVDYWRGNAQHNLTETERREYEQRLQQQNIEHEKEAAELAAEACAKAKAIWNGAAVAPPDHPYLQRKKILGSGARVDKSGTLLVPMWHPDHRVIVNLQHITKYGDKYFLRGGLTAGCFAQLSADAKDQPIVIAEGFATAGSISKATGAEVVIAFSASNMPAVAKMVRRVWHNAEAAIWKEHKEGHAEQGITAVATGLGLHTELVIAADDDWQHKDNPGLVAAITAARAAQALVALPRFGKERLNEDTDFNDLACWYEDGDEYVRQNIAKAAPPTAVLERLLMDNPNAGPMLELMAACRSDDLSWYERLVAELKTKKIRIREFDGEIKRRAAKAAKAAKARAAKAPVQVDIERLARSAADIIACEDVLSRFADECGQVIAGERAATKLSYLSATSRLFEKAMHVVYKGPSAGGKSETRRRVLDFFPPEDVIAFTSLSEKALLFFEDDFAHKILSMGEAISNEEIKFQDYLLRELLSEDQLRYPMVQKQQDGSLKTITIVKNGPVAFMVTTTRNSLNPENETRDVVARNQRHAGADQKSAQHGGAGCRPQSGPREHRSGAVARLPALAGGGRTAGLGAVCGRAGGVNSAEGGAAAARLPAGAAGHHGARLAAS